MTNQARSATLWVSVQLYRCQCLPEEKGLSSGQRSASRMPVSRHREIVAKALAQKCPKLQVENNATPAACPFACSAR